MVSSLDEKMLTLNEAILQCLKKHEESKKRTYNRTDTFLEEKKEPEDLS